MSKSGTFIIAEVGSTHDGSFGNAMRAADAAADCGVDAVKFQTHVAEAETLPNAPAPSYFKGEPRLEYFKRTGFSEAQWSEISSHCDSLGVEFMSSPFSISAVEMMERIGMKTYKIPSGEVTNLPMLDVIGQTKKPVLLSSGMSNWAELDAAVDVLKAHHDNITVLQCTSAYPCPPESIGLNVMMEMKERYELPVGLSDHSVSIFAPIAAAALGATVVEKHFAMSKWMYGSDAWNSLEPSELKNMVNGIRQTSAMINNSVDKDDISDFTEMKNIFQKSIVSTMDIPSGTILTREMLAEKKPGTGIPAAKLNQLVGTKTTSTISANSLISADQLDHEIS